MPEFWQKTATRARQTLPLWRRFYPDLMLGGTTADTFEAAMKLLETLAQMHRMCLQAAQASKRREVAAFAFLRTFNVAVPKLIEGLFPAGDPVRELLPAVYAVVPQSDAPNLRRARLLIPIWSRADAALAARKPGEAIVREGIGVAEFALAVEEYPRLQAASAEAAAPVARARRELREHERKVDALNKRAYLALKGHADPGSELEALLLATVTRERSTRKPAPQAARSGIPRSPLPDAL